MESSEHDEVMPLPSDPHQSEVIDLADEPQASLPSGEGARDTPEPAPVATPTEAIPLEPAEPGTYWCETEGGAGHHHILGQLIEGENDFTWVTTDEQKLALASFVQAGVLEKMEDSTSKDPNG